MNIAQRGSIFQLKIRWLRDAVFTNLWTVERGELVLNLWNRGLKGHLFIRGILGGDGLFTNLWTKGGRGEGLNTSISFILVKQIPILGFCNLFSRFYE
ncbi:hypothetical protein D6D85_11940 [Candidatus Methanodesulfokora washburnensis]|uniref:Uncharacterized protein n=1 Tax=Candidatus Methanodesulfokora washburnensis TaxID=2478471 RepID=A0A429GGB2_9CREN|nr:hypothetical protein D6D85_11940 [Candidatus Methanodesulfokores washburnensis]